MKLKNTLKDKVQSYKPSKHYRQQQFIIIRRSPINPAPEASE